MLLIASSSTDVARTSTETITKAIKAINAAKIAELSSIESKITLEKFEDEAN